ncbi:hypothetical protein RJ640_029534, partial [Escallonia rubra]
GETHIERAVKLKENVRMMLDKLEEEAPLHRLEMIDTVQRLGISYHFGFEIKKILESIYRCDHRSSRWNEADLYAIALEFRLLRQHGYEVPQEVFRRFTDETGMFKECLCEDTREILYLYEATYFSIPGESILDEARDFTTKHLKESLNDKNIDQNLAMLVRHSLELPLHWRMLRLEACWFIDAYGRSEDMNSNLLDLAKLDFNMVQAIHQDDLKHMSRWWKSTRLGEKMTFSRDRLMENFLWTVGVIFEPEFQYFRRMFTKVNTLITTIDDLYDVYGTLEELELFTNAVERWDVNEMERVPDYMRICFLTLYNSINEMAYDTLKERGFNTIPYLKNAWTDLCKCYLLEAKWYKSGHTPTLEEYMNNAWISISAPLILTHAYFLADNPTTEEALAYLEKYPNIIRWSSIILRLSDDLGTSQDELQRGDNPKSIQCYMHETGASEEDAREHISHLISETWKKMNEDRVASSLFNQTFIGAAINLARTAQCMYQHGDGHGIQDRETKDRVLSLLINPIPLGSTNNKKVLKWLAALQLRLSDDLRTSQVETHTERAVNLKEDVRMMLDRVEEEEAVPLHRLELIDTVQRLGISYHFGVEIKKILESIYHCDHRSSRWNEEDLYAIALEFRLLRQHGYEVPQDVFRRFIDESGKFKACLCEDTRGILYLYEATYLSIPGESILDEARDFTTKHLKESLNDENIDQNLAMLVRHSLELPLHWRMLIKAGGMRMSTKVNSLITTIDDLYDVYGTLEELELFTNAVERWDANEMERVPDYMRICFLALYNSINEMGYDTLKERGFNIIPYLKNTVYYLLEAKRYKSGYIPALEEYINNAWISISAPVMLIQAYFFVENPITKEALVCLEKYPNIIRWPSMILRLSNDLGTSQDELQRGDNPKSIQCYMHETSASEEDAHKHIRHLISETWKKMNEDRVA